MRYSRYWIIGFSVLLTNWTAGNFARAEGAIRAQTSQITVAGSRCVIPQLLCFAPREQNRALVLQSTQTQQPEKASTGDQIGQRPVMIQNIRLVPTDFERKDSLAVIPAKWITSQINPATNLPPQKFISIPVQFDFTEVASSGEYSGTLIIEHSRGDLAVPVTLKIKDSWHLTVPMLLAGVLLAFLLAIYQAEGFDRDEITIKVGQLRLQMKSEVEGNPNEAEIARIFQTKVESYLVDVATCLDTKAWIEARKSLSEAQAVWSRWRKQRNAWIDLYEYMKDALESQIGADIPEESAYGKDFSYEINRLKRETADCETPQKLAESLKPLREKIQPFLDAKGGYEKLNNLRTHVVNASEQWRQPLIDLEKRLNKISLGDTARLQIWQKDAENLEQQMKEAFKEREPSTRGASIGSATVGIVRSVPVVETQDGKDTIQPANWRLRAFRWAGQGVAIAILCGAGFNQLYATNPTFGANPVADYTSLFAWGFTAEVTRESVAKVLQRFKLPGSGTGSS